MRVHALGPALLAVLLLVAAGCGGGGTKTTTTTAPATTAAKTSAATTTAATTSAATTSASDLSGLASVANCKQLTDLGTQFSQAMTGTAAGDTKKLAQLLQEFAAKTPAEVRPDFEVVAAAYAKIAEAMSGAKVGATPDPSTILKLQKLAGQLDEPKLTKAWAHISAWAKTNCKA